MKSFVVLTIAILFTLNNSYSQAYYSDKVKKLWETPAVFKVPESVILDINREIVYVSNINGDPTEVDANGFISKLGVDGKIVNLKWITGLNAPKGMGIIADTLYVADVNQVVKIDIQLGEIIDIYDAEGAVFLNDISIDDQGRVFISDSGISAIYVLENNSLSVFLPAGSFERSNGLFCMDDKMFVGTKGKIKSVNLENKRIRDVMTVDCGIDGLEIWKKKYFVFSDWVGKVQMAGPNSDPVVLFDTTPESINAADIELMGKSNMILVPTFFDNRVMAYEIFE